MSLGVRLRLSGGTTCKAAQRSKAFISQREGVAALSLTCTEVPGIRRPVEMPTTSAFQWAFQDISVLFLPLGYKITEHFEYTSLMLKPTKDEWQN